MPDSEEKAVVVKAKAETSWVLPSAAPSKPAPEPEKPASGRYVPPSLARKEKAPVLGELSFPSLADSMSKTCVRPLCLHTAW